MIDCDNSELTSCLIYRLVALMGNFISGGRTSQDTVGGDDHRIPREHWPNVDVTWVDFQKRRKSPYYVENDQDDGDDMGLNGFLFPGGFVIPDSVIELILALVRPEDILRCNLVRNTQNCLWEYYC